MGLRFGFRIGPFSVSASTRRRRRRPKRRDLIAAAAQRAAAHEAEMQRRAFGDRIGAMSAEEYREHAMRTDPDWALAELHRQATVKAEAEAELQRMKVELQGDA